MKKVLSIILAVIMTFGVCVVASSAIKVSDLPEIPEAKDGKIYFAAGNAFARAGDTVDIPVYLVSDFTTTCTDGFVQLGVKFTVTGDFPGKINSIAFTDEIKNSDGFHEMLCCYLDPDNDVPEELMDKDMEIQEGSGIGNGYITFAAGLGILKAGKVQIATINMTMHENFNDGYDETDPNEDSEFNAIEFAPYNFSNSYVGCWFDGQGAVIEGEYPEGNPEAGSVEAGAEMEMINLLLPVDADDNGQIGLSNGIVMGFEPKEKWSNTLIDWLYKTVEDIYEQLDTVRAFILTIIAALKMI